MLTCFTSDIHGARKLYGQLTDLLRADKPELLILGGDLLRDVDRDQPILPQVAAMAHELIERVAAWQADVPRMAVACILGNHELACARDELQKHHDAGRIVLLDHRRLWHHGGIAWLGYSCSPPSPHWAKDFERLDLPGDPIPDFPGVEWDPREEQLREVDLVEYFRRQPSLADDLEHAPSAPDPWILVAHAPPHDSNLDRLPSVPHPIGSRAVRRFIEQRQPRLALHGHVHESPSVTGSYTDRIGATVCVNPGQSHEQLHAVLFDARRPAETMRHTVFT